MLELNNLDRVFERIQSAHQFQFAKFKNTQYHAEVDKIALSSRGSPYDYIHECVHRELMRSTLGVLYFSLNKIYEIMVDSFSTKFGEELRRFFRWSSKLPGTLKYLYIVERLDDFLAHLAGKEEFVSFCEFCVQFRDKCLSLLDHTRLVQEGTAIYVSSHTEFGSGPETDELTQWQAEEQNRYQEPGKAPSYYVEAYQTACCLSELWGGDSCFFLGFLALCPPLDDLDIVGIPSAELAERLSGDKNSDAIWKRFLLVEPAYIRRFTWAPEKNWEAFYQDFFGSELRFPESPPYFDDRRLIDQLNRFLGRTCFHESLEEYYRPDCTYPLPVRPMSYVDTEHYLSKSWNYGAWVGHTVHFHKKHSEEWDQEDWQSDAESDLMQKADLNLIIHWKNMTDIMRNVVELAR